MLPETAVAYNMSTQLGQKHLKLLDQLRLHLIIMPILIQQTSITITPKYHSTTRTTLTTTNHSPPHNSKTSSPHKNPPSTPNYTATSYQNAMDNIGGVSFASSSREQFPLLYWRPTSQHRWDDGYVAESHLAAKYWWWRRGGDEEGHWISVDGYRVGDIVEWGT